MNCEPVVCFYFIALYDRIKPGQAEPICSMSDSILKTALPLSKDIFTLTNSDILLADLCSVCTDVYLYTHTRIYITVDATHLQSTCIMFCTAPPSLLHPVRVF